MRLWVLALLVGAALLAVAPAHAAASRRRAVQYVGQVNLNEASATQLDALPGVGEKAAQSIVAYREKRRFGRVEELVKVKGFGKKRFLLLRPHLTLEGPSTFRVERLPAGGGRGAAR
ncbi:helix-hairpin-helix domain-containing protein [Aggregicoccus sp. 17bor-14]|nr:MULTISPECIES: helix-hairpin-helix domain-containing protein [Myxococcaceae]MBF5041911.1 helix-hairpin-helix domain-containing protein [Simulacricoccus sp. 17bor-14]MRI87692.1 helix-hairpin-helix domain-containing protein [Aggregicoccus sp. 17bor-14]